MKFMGSKNRHSKELLPIILAGRKSELYVEPFVGGANMMDKVVGRRLGSDVDDDLILLWAAVADGWMPPKKFSEAQYNAIKKAPPRTLARLCCVCVIIWG